MSLRNNSLIGTFIEEEEVTTGTARVIIEQFDASKIFIFKIDNNSEDENARFLVTFNIDKKVKNQQLRDFKNKYKNTVHLHRNKDHNTLFTINSLNKVVQDQAGFKDINYKVDWSDYKNCCVLLSNDGSLKIMKTKLVDIVEI